MSDPVIKLVAKYVLAQEKRAAVEVGQFIRNSDDDFHVRLSHNLSKRAFGENAMQYIQDIVASAKEHGNNFAKNVPAGISALRDSAKNPLSAALMGGATGAALGTGAGLLSGSNVLGKALQGGVAGATLGGGASLAAGAMGNRVADPAIADQVAQLTNAIDETQGSSGTNYGGRAGGLLAGMRGMNAVDDLTSGTSPGRVLGGENMNTMTDRLNLIKRLEGWRNTGGKDKKLGSDSIDAFIDLLNKQDNPEGARSLFHELTKSLDGQDGITNANTLLTQKGIAGGDADISSIVRAIKESREGGFSFLPRNILGRLGLAGDTGTRMMPLQQMNSALSRPILRGRNGAIMALAGAGGLSAYDMYNNSSPNTGSVDAETIQSIRDRLNSP